MGSKRTAPSPPVECCMCGDRGVSRELFRCKSCQFRFQHKYCSDLYPKAESYRSCNWCLRDQEGLKSVVNAKEDHNSPTTISSSPTCSSENNNNNNNSNSNSSNLLAAGKLQQRGAFSTHLTKPVKKQKSPERSEKSSPETAIASAAKVKSEEISSSGVGGRITRQGSRGKIRRYKLLEEVSS